MSEFYMRLMALSHPQKVEITREQFEDLECAVNIQTEALYIEQKYDFVMENYFEFEESILRCGLSKMLLAGRERKESNADTALFNRRIMNFLTACRTYDDTYRQHFNRIFFKDKEILRKVKLSFSEEYDNRVGYWMISKIRNYVQHQGFPMHGSIYSSEWIKDVFDVDKHRYTIELYISSQELSRGKFNLEIKKRLSAMQEKVDLKFLIRDFMEGFSAAHVRNREILRDRLEWSSDYISSVIDEFLVSTGYPSANSLISFGSETSVSVAHFAKDQRLYLVKKNASLVGLCARYISNEIDSNEINNLK